MLTILQGEASEGKIDKDWRIWSEKSGISKWSTSMHYL
jgi:hypothetical protein